MNFKEWLNNEENVNGLFEATIPLAEREKMAKAYAIMIAHFYNEFKRMPLQRGSDQKLEGEQYNFNDEQLSERQLGIRLRKFKMAKKAHLQNKKNTNPHYPSAEQAGIEAGLPPDWMISKDGDADTLEQNAIKYAIMIAHFYNEFKRMPTKLGSDQELKGNKYNFNDEQVSERQLVNRLESFKMAKKAHLQNKKNNHAYYPSAEQAGIEAGLPPDWLDAKDGDADTLEQNAIKYAIMIAHFYNDFQRMPTKLGSDQELKGNKYNFNGKQVLERQLVNRLQNFKINKKAHLQNKKNTGPHYPSAEQAGINAGLPPDWMGSKDSDVNTLEQNAIKYAIMIANFYNEFKRMPSELGNNQKLEGEQYNFNDEQLSERQLGNRLASFKQSKKAHLQNKKIYKVYYPSAEEAGIEAGLPPDWMAGGDGTPKKFANHHELLHILKNLDMAQNFNFQEEMVCFRQDKRCLRYDGSYKDADNNTIAVFEYQGEQHYHPNNLVGLRKFIKTRQNDEEKLKITKDNNIPLLRIPYWKNNQKPSLVKEFMQAVLNASNNKLSPSQWKHYAIDIATPDVQQEIVIDKEFCKYFNSPKGKTDAALAALYPEIKKKWEMCNEKK